MKIVMRELQLPAKVIMINKNVNHLNGEKNRENMGLWERKKEKIIAYFSVKSAL